MLAGVFAVKNPFNCGVRLEKIAGLMSFFSDLYELTILYVRVAPSN